MKKMAYYISDYGFGHATRSIAIVRKLLETSDGIHIAVCTSYSLPFIKKSLSSYQNNQVEFRNVQNDIGFILRENSVMPDIPKFKSIYKSFITQSKGYVENEVLFLSLNDIDLVIGDIPPFPFLAADQLQIPSIGISNFTWYTAYLDFLTQDELAPLKEAYEKMDTLIQLAGCNETGYRLNEVYETGFLTRSFHREKIEQVKKKLNPKGDKIIVYFGLGMKIQVDELSAYPLWSSDECVFIVSSNTNVLGENIFQIPVEDTETQDYIAAADLVISKPGWGTVAEAIQSQTPLLIVNRSNMREDQNTINYLKVMNHCELIEWEDLKTFKMTRDFMKRVNKQIKEETPSDNEPILNDTVNIIQSKLI